MTNFITQHWIAIVIYLIGCILAYGRVGAVTYTDQREIGYKSINPSVWGLVTICSWIGLLSVHIASIHGGKTLWVFKWLPIILMMFCVGCSTIPAKYICLTVDGIEVPSNVQYPSHKEVWQGMIDSCYSTNDTIKH